MSSATRIARQEAVARAMARLTATSDPVPAPTSYVHVVRPPGPWGPSVMARVAARRTPSNVLYERIVREHGPVAHTRMLGEHVYLLGDPGDVVDVFLTHSRDLMKGRGLKATRPLLGNGLLTSEGEAHLRQRRLAAPAFHRARIAEYAEAMVAETLAHAQRWTDGAQLDLVDEMSALTFAIVGRTLFGTDLTGDTATVRDTLAELLAGFSRLAMVADERLVARTPTGRRLLARTADLDQVVDRIVAEHRVGLEDRRDLLAWFLQARDEGVGMTDEQLRDEVMTMILAGHETTAMALSWTWYLLATNPLAAEALHAELATVLGGRPPTFDDLPALPVTYGCVAESIRLYPPAWVIGRRSLVDLSVGGWAVPSGSILLTMPYAQHRDPAYWTDATSYAPSRWLTASGAFDEAAPGVPKGSWIPFGFGNRRCIGEQFAWTEAVLVLATLAQHWSPRMLPGRRVAMFAGVTLRPSPGLPVRLHHR